MHTIKRLDYFLLKSFLPLFIMTFGLCLFIFLMQFLWKYVDEMVGKGIDNHILFQLFFYTAMSLVPQALPLAILFASLMTFGNLGEQYELLAMKSSGISLTRIMKPLSYFLVVVAISAFFFQNNVIPVSQVKMYTILNSVRQKSSELEVPVNTFYSEINGINIYVGGKDNKKKLLKDIMIYDYSEGFLYINVIVADSGRFKMSLDKKYIVMTLYSGESFQNFKGTNTRAREAKDVVPYTRQTFDLMEMLIEFDSNFNMSQESIFQDRFVGKNITNLRRSIDTMTVKLDSIREVDSKAIINQSYKKSLANSLPVQKQNNNDTLTVKQTVNFDSLISVQSRDVKASLYSHSRREIENLRMNYSNRSVLLKFEGKELRLHHTEMHRKFTLSFACIVFFFIGAPLGAIIRKGGLGASAVISVILFIIYYIIDNSGYKFARDGIVEPWEGMWLSSLVLFPLGVFLTYKAVNDSVILNAETYLDSLKSLIGRREYRKVEKKDLIIEIPDYDAVEVNLDILKSSCNKYLAENKRWLHYYKFWKQGGFDCEAEQIAQELEGIVEILENSDQNLILNKIMDFPIIKGYKLTGFNISRKLGIALAILFPVGGVVYFLAAYRRKLLYQDIKVTGRVCDELISILKINN